MNSANENAKKKNCHSSGRQAGAREILRVRLPVEDASRRPPGPLDPSSRCGSAFGSSVAVQTMLDAEKNAAAKIGYV